MEAETELPRPRLATRQKAILEAASQAVGAGVSAFALEVVTEAAADVPADRQAFLLDENSWQMFDDALRRPERDVVGLQKLLTARNN
ncbi:type II toxin-antitoxin system TacA family antitoxin [Actinoplanes derwentensis]|uniref:Uncharacterized conserved protein, DUF1778 family n=1 Tax=Actinoplanes derwentensis TaxID=113562 RepID=A0A1H1PIP5_9ACTN|nr:DUF1778 domain-containing protein [Actinoplanes derwentensis]GID84916.1 hypothetical protein Ade03nite_38400 [Actinoplanes derwentensis]SDS10947.1 Uncharacterized conserved protein, DUF1778 family [Actinoplanes derwentensis]